MATANNPFDVTAPEDNQSLLTAGATQTMAGATPIAQTPTSQYNPTPNLAPQTYTAQTSNVNAPTETMQGQLSSIMAKDNPLMRLARTSATQQMAQRGLINSSMAAGAGTAAMLDKALPIAQQDSQIYSNRALANQDATNQQNQFNTAQTNDVYKFGQDVAARYGLQTAQQQFEAGQNAAQREFQTGERLGTQGFQESMANLAQQNELARMSQAQLYNMEQLGSQQAFQQRIAVLEQSGMDYRQARELTSREMLAAMEQAGITNRFDKELALKAEQFNVEQYNLERRQIQENDAALQRLNLQIEANKAQIPTTFAANISNTTMAGVNAVMADPNMSPEAKQTAINNLVSYANSQINWAEKVYGTTIPDLTGATLTTPSA